MKKGVAKKATKSVKKKVVRSVKKSVARAKVLDFEANDTAHVIFCGSSFEYNSDTPPKPIRLKIQGEAAVCPTNSPRPRFDAFDYRIFYNNQELTSKTVVCGNPNYIGEISLDLNGIPDGPSNPLVDELTVTVMTRKKVTLPPTIAVGVGVRSVPSDSPAGTAKKRVTRTKKKSQK